MPETEAEPEPEVEPVKEVCPFQGCNCLKECALYTTVQHMDKGVRYHREGCALKILAMYTALAPAVHPLGPIGGRRPPGMPEMMVGPPSMWPTHPGAPRPGPRPTIPRPHRHPGPPVEDVLEELEKIDSSKVKDYRRKME